MAQACASPRRAYQTCQPSSPCNTGIITYQKGVRDGRRGRLILHLGKVLLQLEPLREHSAILTPFNVQVDKFLSPGDHVVTRVLFSPKDGGSIFKAENRYHLTSAVVKLHWEGTQDLLEHYDVHRIVCKDREASRALPNLCSRWQS